MFAFGITGLIVSLLVAFVSYELTRSTLISQREQVAERQAYLNARSVRSSLLSQTTSTSAALERVQTSSGGIALVRVGDEWFSTSVSAGRSDVPPSLLTAVDEGVAARQRTMTTDGPAVAVGVPLAGAKAVYVEFVPFDEVDATLSKVARGLAIAVAAATLAGVLAGRWLTTRILRPLRQTIAAANGIREGALDRRLASDGDSDLEPLVESFNAMVESLQVRIEREARFASDVTHELRSPLATMGAALSVARRRASEPATLQALDILGAEVERFQELIIDLLEIARAEAGVAELAMDEIEPRSLAQSVLDASGRDQVTIEVDTEGERRAQLDKRRIGQALVNLLDNADNYGGGATKLTVTGDAEFLRFIVDDEGPGVPEHERDHVFQRFARGTHADVSGTGLGLALVTEHVRLHHGHITVSDAPGGGARFIIEIPREQS